MENEQFSSLNQTAHQLSLEIYTFIVVKHISLTIFNIFYDKIEIRNPSRFTFTWQIDATIRDVNAFIAEKPDSND